MFTSMCWNLNRNIALSVMKLFIDMLNIVLSIILTLPFTAILHNSNSMQYGTSMHILSSFRIVKTTLLEKCCFVWTVNDAANAYFSSELFTSPGTSSKALALRLILDSVSMVIDVSLTLFRIRRSSSDQRIAELQALMALVQSGGMVAHGQYDPLSM